MFQTRTKQHPDSCWRLIVLDWQQTIHMALWILQCCWGQNINSDRTVTTWIAAQAETATLHLTPRTALWHRKNKTKSQFIQHLHIKLNYLILNVCELPSRISWSKETEIPMCYVLNGKLWKRKTPEQWGGGIRKKKGIQRQNMWKQQAVMRTRTNCALKRAQKRICPTCTMRRFLETWEWK